MLDQKHFEAIAARAAAQLRNERQRQGLSMNAVAERAGLSQQMVSYVERGMRTPNLDTFLRMAAALGVEAGAVLSTAAKGGRKR